MEKQYKAAQCIKINPSIGQLAQQEGWRAWELSAAVAIQDWGYATQERVLAELEKQWCAYNPAHRRSGPESIKRTAYHAFRWWITHKFMLVELGHI